MLRNYVKIALRHLRKHKVYSAVNILGFAIGIACFLLIVLYIRDESAYDRYHARAESIYRISESTFADGVGEASASVPIPLGPTLKQDFPHLVKGAVRFFNFSAPSLSLEYTKDKHFNEQRLFFTDPDIFRVFSFHLLKGNPETALRDPNTIVLTRAMAEKYFGTAEPIGKILRFEDKYELTVTGVLDEVPPQSHFRFDFLVSFSTALPMLTERQRTSWFWNPCYTYVQLADASPPTRRKFDALLPGVVLKYFPENIRKNTKLESQPLTAIYLTSRLGNEIEPTGSLAYLYTFGAIGCFILLIAVINFMNLTTARSVSRAKEVGLRKVLGSERQQLVGQFIGESVLLSLFATLLAAGLAQLALPFLNAFTEKNLSFHFLDNGFIYGSLLGLAVIVGIGAGVYPAFYLSSFKPVKVLKGQVTRGKGGVRLRQSLVVIQFSLSIILIVGTIVAYRQLHYLQTAQLGFRKDQVIIVPITRSALSTISRFEDFKSRLLRHPSVRQVTATEEVLGKGHNSGSYRPEGAGRDMLFPRLFVREDFTETFDIPLVAGRGFSREYRGDRRQSGVLINESMVKHLGWESARAAVGRRINEYPTDSGSVVVRIVGVVRDFHVTSLHQSIKPFVIEGPPVRDAHNQFFIKFMAVKIAGNRTTEAIAHLEALWKESVPDRAFDYFFLDEHLNRMYGAEMRFSRVVAVFSDLAIFIACLGLFGLATFMAESRTKEIGVRKVLGASDLSVLALLSGDFLKLVVIAFVLASPVAWYVLNGWLRSFAYQIAVEWWVFALAGLLATGIALLTVSSQSIKAALSNPVKSLRAE